MILTIENRIRQTKVYQFLKIKILKLFKLTEEDYYKETYNLKPLAIKQFAFHLYDFIITALGIQFLYMAEANPIMAPFFHEQYPLVVGFIFKIGAISIFLLYLLKRQANKHNYIYGKITLSILNKIMLLVIVWNTFNAILHIMAIAGGWNG